MKVRRAKSVAEKHQARIAREDARMPEPIRGVLSPQEPRRLGSARVEAVPYEGVAPLVTLDDPSAPPGRARGAFARLRPPEGHPPGETASWVNVVRAEALAVRVVAQPRRREVPNPERQPEPSDDVRQESTRIAKATGDADVVALVERIISEVESGT